MSEQIKNLKNDMVEAQKERTRLGKQVIENMNQIDKLSKRIEAYIRELEQKKALRKAVEHLKKS